MHPSFHPPGRRSRTATGLALTGLATAGALALLGACGQSSHPSSTGAGAITPGPGQHQTAGMPGMSMSTMPAMSTTPTHAGTGAPVSGTAVAIKNFAFSPAALKVPVGTTVTWTNEDTDAHTVTSSGPGGPLSSPALATHATYRYTFTKPGTYAYLCTVHPFMTATVEVTR
ncbi:cupredoxin family copper-binding protein [Streptomyces sp. NPDC048277]|uniref:cupredoxin domain-containing protein n=1 Tax=Streptomyces sp. NPDC048277 TaxID=3155027 RepID=UPI0033F1D0A2